jgi:hypothetical protein
MLLKTERLVFYNKPSGATVTSLRRRRVVAECLAEAPARRELAELRLSRKLKAPQHLPDSCRPCVEQAGPKIKYYYATLLLENGKLGKMMATVDCRPDADGIRRVFLFGPVVEAGDPRNWAEMRSKSQEQAAVRERNSLTDFLFNSKLTTSWD